MSGNLNSRRGWKGVQLIALVALVALLVALALFDPATGWTPACPTRTLTGLPCPGCGTLRAVHALLNGRVSDALRLNALTTVGLGLGLPALFWRKEISTWLDAEPARRVRAWWVCGGGVVLFSVLRLALGSDV